MLAPLTTIVPVSGWSSPAHMLSTVLFPHPLGPTMLVKLPSGTSRQMSSQTRFTTFPADVNDLVTLLTLTYEVLFSSSLAGGAVTDEGCCWGIGITPRQRCGHPGCFGCSACARPLLLSLGMTP